MRFYTFGEKNAPVILLLPGTCCHWRLNFGGVIDALAQDFRVVCASYDGFDETEDTVFPDMQTETERLEAYISDQLGGHIRAAYGCSLGGSFVGLLLQRGNIRIDHAILGSSDLDQEAPWRAKIKCAVAIPLLHRIVSTGEYPRLLRGLMEKKRTPYRDSFMAMFRIGEGGLPFLRRESVYNQFYSDLVTPLEEQISVPGTAVHCFYAAGMGEEYLRRYRRHFANPVIHRFEMAHEELLLMYPDRWVNEVKAACL